MRQIWPRLREKRVKFSRHKFVLVKQHLKPKQRNKSRSASKLKNVLVTRLILLRSRGNLRRSSI